MQAINGNKDAISNLSTTLNCDINAVQSALNQINAGVSQISCDTKLSSCEVINAITSGNANLASQLANCCCTTQRSIDAVNNNITKMGYENQLSVCNQTNNLVNTMNSNTLSLRDNNTANTQSIIAKLDAMQNQALLDKIDALLEKLDIPKEPTNTEDPRIKELQDEVNELKNIIKQASSMVPPPMKQMLPHNMQNVMKEVDQ